MTRRSDTPIVLPEGFVTPPGYVLVTHQSWHTLQVLFRVLGGLFLLLLGAVVALQLQVSSRNRDLDTVKLSVARVEIASERAQTASESANETLQAAIAQSQSQDSSQFVAAVLQIDAVCAATLGRPPCDQLRQKARELTGPPTTTPPGG